MFLTPYPHMLHGADYNPEQWMQSPDILRQDIEQMKQANMNCMSVGIFAWSALEPAEGEYRLDWLGEVIDRLYENGIYTVLATPSGAKPLWMSQKYPEIRRVSAQRVRELSGGRHNHCYTSPVYREKVYAINRQLANRFGRHPGVILWHISNELQGECHCPLCQEAFREWLKTRYGTLEALNAAWWTAFWSHTYTDWSQIEPPSPRGETAVHGLTLDWKRFVTHQTCTFFENETAPIRAANPDLPVTTNLMGFYDGIDYRRLAPLVDVVSWDSYPVWHSRPDGDETFNAFWADAFSDYCRSMLGKPFLIMENTPSQTNWQEVCRPKTWGFHRLTAISNLAHGADSIQYFQWRQSRGCAEKFHGAVMTHANRTDTRVFQEVAGVGAMLKKLDALCGAQTPARTAILYDTESHWAVNAAQGPRNAGIGDTDLMLRFYLPFWQAGIPVDIVDSDADFTGYDLLLVPMLYLLRGDVSRRLQEFARRGGTLVMTLHTGLTDEHDLCYMGDTPGEGLAALAGIRYLETDPLYDGMEERIRILRAPFPLAEEYRCERLCERIAAEGAEVLAVYGHDNPCMPDDLPCLTRNAVGRGTVYYLAAYPEQKFLLDFLLRLASRLGIQPALETALPYGVVTAVRVATDGTRFLFAMNWTREKQSVSLPYPLRDYETGRLYQNVLPLSPYGAKILVAANSKA